MISILLADDHSIVRTGIKLLINNNIDMRVEYEAEDGDEAVRIAIEKKPDIVIMDLNMPKKNGLLAIKEISEANENIKIITLTMHEEKEYIFRAIQAGASSYLLKSHKEHELIDAIRAVYKGDAYLYPNATKVLLDDYLEKVKLSGGNKIIELTEREEEILHLLALGYTNREIAEQLYLSVKTIESHRSNIMEKLNLRTRSDLVKYAMKKGYLEFSF